MGSGISNPFDANGDCAASGGVRGREGSEELVEVSQQPDEHLEEMSPSRAMSRDDDREDFREDLPEDPPRDEPPRDEAPPPTPRPPRLGRRGKRLCPPFAGRRGRGGEVAAEVVAPLNGGGKGGEVLTEPSEC